MFKKLIKRNLLKGGKMKKNEINNEYRNHIRDFPCCVLKDCFGIVHAHHVTTKGAEGKDEANLVPLCAKHHSEIHLMGRNSFKEKYFLNLEDLADRLYKSWGK
jgi:hypothetical protein